MHFDATRNRFTKNLTSGSGSYEMSERQFLAIKNAHVGGSLRMLRDWLQSRTSDQVDPATLLSFRDIYQQSIDTGDTEHLEEDEQED